MKGNLNQKEVNIIIEDLIGKIKRLRSKNTNLNKLNKLSASKDKKQLEEIKDLNSNNDKLKSIVNEQNIEVKSLNKKISESKEDAIKIVNLENQNRENLNTINDLKSKQDTLSTKASQLIDELSKLTQSNTQLISERKKLEKENKLNARTASDLVKEKDKLIEGVQLLNGKLNSATTQNNKLVKVIEDQNKKTEKLDSVLEINDKLQSALLAEKNAHQKSKEKLSKRSSRRVSKFRSGMAKSSSSSKGPKEDYLYRHYKNNYNKGDMATANVYNEMSVKIHGVNLHNKYSDKLNKKEEDGGMFGMKKYKRIRYG